MKWVLLAIATLGAVVARRVGVMSLLGAVNGLVVAAILILFSEWPVFAALGYLVVGGSVVSVIARERKQELGLHEAKGEERGVAQVYANAGSALLITYLAWELDVSNDTYMRLIIGAVGGLGAAFADTVSGEIGIFSKTPPRLLLVGRRVEPGEDGGMTALGTAAGLGTAVLVGALGAFAFGRPEWALPIACGAFSGTLIDSLLGVVVEPHLDTPFANEWNNFFSSTLGAGVTILLV